MVVDGPKVDIRLQGLARDAAREHILPGVAESVVNQDPGHVLHLSLLVRCEQNRGAIAASAKLSHIWRRGWIDGGVDTDLGPAEGGAILQFACEHSGL